MAWLVSGLKSFAISNDDDEDEEKTPTPKESKKETSGNNEASQNVALLKIFQKLKDVNLGNLPKSERKDLIESLKNQSHISKMSSSDVKMLGGVIPSLVTCLQLDRTDPEIVKHCLQICLNMVCIGNSQDPTPLPANSIQLYNSDLFDLPTVSVFVSLLEETDFSIRFYTTTLLRILATNKTKKLQQHILLVPMGIARVIDLLREQRELIRNEGLLLLKEISRDHPEIQKIVAFEGAFEMLFSIIQNEGLNEASIIVQDCMMLINNLLKGSPSNQNYFRETNTIKRLPPLLEVSGTEFLGFPSEDKITQLLLSLDMITILVESEQERKLNQSALANIKVLDQLIEIGLGKNQLMPVKIKALTTLGAVIHGHDENCTLFAKKQIDSQTAVQRTVNLIWTTKDNAERNAALDLMQQYLVDNNQIQIGIVSTFTPPPAPVEFVQASLGTQLVQTIFNWDQESQIPLQSFTAACIVSYLLHSNNTAKEMVLKVPIEIPAIDSTGPPLTLIGKLLTTLTACAKITSPSTKCLWFQIGLLIVLFELVSGFPKGIQVISNSKIYTQLLLDLTNAVSLFQQERLITHLQGLAVSVLLACLFGSESLDLKSAVKQRIEQDALTKKLEALQNSNEFRAAEQSTRFDGIGFYTHAFTTTISDFKTKIPLLFSSQQKENPSTKPLNISSPTISTNISSPPISTNISSPTISTNISSPPISTNHQEITPHSQELIKTYQVLLERSDHKNKELSSQIKELEEKLRVLENSSVPKSNFETIQKELQQTQQNLQNSQKEVRSLENQLKQANENVIQLSKKLESSEKELKHINTEHEDLLVVLAEIETENKQFKKQLGIPDDEDDEDEE